MPRVLLVPLVLSVIWFTSHGCGPATPVASGPQGLFEQHCARCHAQAGEPGGPGLGSSKGPNLNKIGSEPGRDARYIEAMIRDPNSKRPNAKLMQSFEGKLTDEEIRSLAEYLAAKK